MPTDQRSIELKTGFFHLSRRSFIQGATGVLTAAAVYGIYRYFAHKGVAVSQASSGDHPAPVSVRTAFTVNGTERQVTLDARTTLLDTLRDHLSLTGSKKGCDQGQCGACTVLVDGRRVLSCLTLTATLGGRAVTTIEGLAKADGTLHPMQAAFIEHDAYQCGYCTPGQIMSAVACVREKHAGSDDEIREYMSGNLCRCAAYPKIVVAIRQARDQMEAA